MLTNKIRYLFDKIRLVCIRLTKWYLRGLDNGHVMKVNGKMIGFISRDGFIFFDQVPPKPSQLNEKSSNESTHEHSPEQK